MRKQMVKIAARVVAVGALASPMAAISGCQAIAGVENRSVDPVLEGCTLPATGAAKIRFADLVPDDDFVDVCVRPSGGAYGRPLLRGAGTGCAKPLGRAQAGYKYGEVSIPFASPAGKVDVKVVRAGDTCGGSTLTEQTGLDVPAGLTTTVARMGNEKGQKLAAFTDAPDRAASGNMKFRLVHAVPGIPSLDFGIGSGPRLPADVKSAITKTPLAYGTATTSSTGLAFGTMDPHGYITTPGTELNIAAAKAGEKRALLLATLPGVEGGRTMFAVGDPTKPYFQVRALVCDENDSDGPLRTKCSFSALGTISTDAFNAYLYGSFAPDEDARRPYVIKTIAERPSDLMCVVSLSRKADRDAVIAAAKDKGFAYSYVSDTNLDTQPTDPRDQSGATPPPFTTPSCGGTNDPMAVDAALQCLVDNCSTTGTWDGTNKGGSSCVSSKCAAEFVPFLGGDRDHGRCFNCMVVGSLSDTTVAQVKDRCTTDTREYRAFDGQTDSIVLSRFPLTKQDTYVLPATGYQRVVHGVTAEIEKDKFVDFYCAELTAAFGDLLPYFGPYAPDATKDKWFQEQALQAQRVVEYVKKRSGTTPAIITGDWAVSAEYKDMTTGKTIIDDQNGTVFTDILDKELVFAHPDKWEPQCTECASDVNPYNGDKNVLQFKTFVLNLPASSGVEINIWGKDRIVPVGGMMMPVSDRFGYNTLILRP